MLLRNIMDVKSKAMSARCNIVLEPLCRGVGAEWERRHKEENPFVPTPPPPPPFRKDSLSNPLPTKT